MCICVCSSIIFRGEQQSMSSPLLLQIVISFSPSVDIPKSFYHYSSKVSAFRTQSQLEFDQINVNLLSQPPLVIFNIQLVEFSSFALYRIKIFFLYSHNNKIVKVTKIYSATNISLIKTISVKRLNLYNQIHTHTHTNILSDKEK